MKTVAFVSQKGGSGKTTLSIHYAVAAAETGLKVAIVDTDPQASSTGWGKAREKEFPTVATCSASEIDKVIEHARNDGYELVVIDAAPHLDPGIARIAAAADFIVVPVRPTPLDIQTAHRAAAVAKASGNPFGFVLNGCPPKAAEIADAFRILGDLGGSVCPMTVGERRAFARAIGTGESVTEFDPFGKSSQEIRSVWMWVETFIRKGVKA